MSFPHRGMTRWFGTASSAWPPPRWRRPSSPCSIEGRTNAPPNRVRCEYHEAKSGCHEHQIELFFRSRAPLIRQVAQRQDCQADEVPRTKSHAPVRRVCKKPCNMATTSTSARGRFIDRSPISYWPQSGYRSGQISPVRQRLLFRAI